MEVASASTSNGVRDYSLSYRADIDGLRAWAVVLVVLFHAKFEAFGGGFIGVDVFFVISGYLITRIIAKEAAVEKFSILKFYERRIRRIIPALCTVVLLTLIAGFFLGLPPSIARMTDSAVATMLFFANFHFWWESSNYFAPATETNPFLHMWSLAVEEQFYIVFPIVVMLFFRYARRFIIPATLIAAIASLLISQIGVEVAPTATFYLAPTRAWEFLAGSLLALNMLPPLKDKSLNTFIALLGLSLILGSALWSDPAMGFPGLNALPPVVGAALVIYSANGALPAFVHIFLTARPILFTGLISYSLYLWHWPILVFAEHLVLLRPLSLAESAICICAAYFAACCTYYFIEQPFRRSRILRSRTRMLTGAAALSLAVSATITLGVATNGMSPLHPSFGNTINEAQKENDRAARQISIENCFVTNTLGRRSEGCIQREGIPGSPAIFLWGDSFADHYVPAISRDAPFGAQTIITYASPQCPPVISYNPRQLPQCPEINKLALEEIRRRNVKTVILAANWNAYLSIDRLDYEDILGTAEMLQDIGLKVIIIGQSPVFYFSNPGEALYLHRARGAENQQVFASQGADAKINERLREIADGFVDPLEILCVDGHRCPFYSDGKYLVSDYGHLTVFGATPIVREVLRIATSNR